MEDVSAVGFIADAFAGISGSVGSNGRGALQHTCSGRRERRSRSSGGSSSGNRKRRRCQPVLILHAAEARHRTFVAQVAAVGGGETHTGLVLVFVLCPVGLERKINVDGLLLEI